jgi:hypothetical protein
MTAPSAAAELNDMLAAAGAITTGHLEVQDPAYLAIVRACVSPLVLALAVLVAEADVEFSERWAAAGTDWMTRGALLHEALLFLLTPERSADA